MKTKKHTDNMPGLTSSEQADLNSDLLRRTEKSLDLLANLQDRISLVSSETADLVENSRLEAYANVSNLQEMTQQAFAAVSKDVDTISERLTALENAPVATSPAPEFDHTWVNRKLSGVYEYIEELEEKIVRLTDHVNREIGVAQEVPLCQRIDFDYGIQDPKVDKEFKFKFLSEPSRPKNPPTTSYMGFNVRFKDNRLLLENADEFEFFVIGDPYTRITELENKCFGLVIYTENKDQYVLCGGPQLVTMFVQFLGPCS